MNFLRHGCNCHWSNSPDWKHIADIHPRHPFCEFYLIDLIKNGSNRYASCYLCQSLFVRKDADKKLMQECRISKDTHPPSDRLIRVYSSSDEGNRPVLFRSSNLSLPEPYCMSCLSYGLEWVKFGTLHSSFKVAREYIMEMIIVGGFSEDIHFCDRCGALYVSSSKAYQSQMLAAGDSSSEEDGGVCNHSSDDSSNQSLSYGP